MNVTEEEVERLRRRVADQEAEIEALRYARDRDELTDILNRHGLDSRVQEWTGQGVGTLTLAMLDLDNFKTVNDSMGHAAGDEILVKVAHQLDLVAERHGGCACRLSGDEFIVVIPHEDHDVAVEVVMEVTVAEVSLGVAHGDAHALRSLMFRADVAMYHSKRTTGSTFTEWTEKTSLPINGRRDRRRNRGGLNDT